MEATDYIEKFNELVQEYKDNDYLVQRLNTFEINPFTNDNVDDIPVEAGYINIDSFYQKPWEKACWRNIRTSIGDLAMQDIVFLSGDPAAIVYYARYNGNVICPNATAYGNPADLKVGASVDTIYVDLTPERRSSGGQLIGEFHKVYRKTKQGDPTAWELITTDAEVFQSNRLRYDGIVDGKFYWDITEKAMYILGAEGPEELDITVDPETEEVTVIKPRRYPWQQFSYKLHGTNGNPTVLPYDLIKKDVDKYFYDYTATNTPLYKFNVETMSWETFGNMINYANVENPEEITTVVDKNGIEYYLLPNISLPSANKERYYYFIPTENIDRLNAKQAEYNQALIEKEEANIVYMAALVEYEAAQNDYLEKYEIARENPTPENIAAAEAAGVVANEKGEILQVAQDDYGEKTVIVNTLKSELTILTSETYDSGKLFRYNYTVCLERIDVSDEIYESAYLFYRNLMHVYGDITDLDRVDNKTLYLTHGHPCKKFLKPDMSRIYLDTKNKKLYKPLENGFHEAEKPFNVVYVTNAESMDDLDPTTLEADTYYFFVERNACFYITRIEVIRKSEVIYYNMQDESEEGRMAIRDIDTGWESDGEYIIMYDDIDAETLEGIFYKLVTLPNLPIEVDSLEDAPLYYNAYYKVGDQYYQYNPYEEIADGHFYFNCGVFY